MKNFTELFTETLNNTLSKMVADAIQCQFDHVETLTDRIAFLETTVKELNEKLDDRDDEYRNDEDRIEIVVRDAIDNYSFADIVKDHQDFESKEFTDAVAAIISDTAFDGPDFEYAVKDVIASALQRHLLGATSNMQ